MTQSVFRLAADHSLGFVVTALVICLTGGWLVGRLLRHISETKEPYRRHWICGTAFVTGITVWTTHFLAMLGYRPDMMLTYDGFITTASAASAILLVGLPLALSPLISSWRQRAALGAVAGFGIGVMHHAGMAALQGCLQTHALAGAIIAYGIGTACLALACALPSRLARPGAICALFALAVCGTHFVSIAAVRIERLAGTVPFEHQHITLTLFTTAGAAILFIGAFLTIIAAQRFQAQERSHLAILSTALDNMSNGLIFLDADRQLRLFNRRYLELCKLSPDALWPGMKTAEFLDALDIAKNWDEDTRNRIAERLEFWMNMVDGETSEHVMLDGRTVQVTSRWVETGGMVLTLDDVTKEREAQRHISELAFCDPLTKLANRRALNLQMEEDFDHKRRFKLLLIDLDRFKPVNDTYGHGMGDRVLIEVGKRLTGVAGPGAFVSRLGGDELAVLVYGDLDLAMAASGQIIDALSQAFQIDDITVNIGCSIGMCCTDDARNATELMQFSDIALYESKRTGRGRTCCFSPGMMEAVAERVGIETEMRTAIARGQMHLAYQPVVALKDDRIVGYEALIRWDHPTLGSISPERFIPLAEETGQIVEIGAWVLQEACAQGATLPGDVYVAVNVSAVQFRSPLLLSHLTKALTASGLPAHRLEIELTETAIVQDGAEIAHMLSTMRHLGVSIAMDDFGTGYSSLAHLRDFPLDRIKIDRSFVATAESDRHSMAVLEGMIYIARQLGITILAEGVETSSQLELLRSIGCDAVQGFLIGYPERMSRPGPIARRTA